MGSRVLEPDLILSPDGKEILYASEREHLECEKRFIDFLTFIFADFIPRTR